jgi:ribokinase
MTGIPALTVVGAINIDLTAHASRAPDRGETVADGVLVRQAGGKGANQAIAAARLGGDVRLLGAVGDDDAGREMTARLAAAGVDVAGVQVVAHATGTALIVVDGEGENSIVVCPGANNHVDPHRLQVEPHAAILAQLEIPASVVEAAVAATDGFVVINVSPATALTPALRTRGDLFIVNESEYESLPDLMTAPLTALTLGARGAVLLQRGVEIARATVPARSVVNSVGAGDAFAAALTVGLLLGDDPQAALHRACAVGAAAVADPQSQPDLITLSTYPATPSDGGTVGVSGSVAESA